MRSGVGYGRRCFLKAIFSLFQNRLTMKFKLLFCGLLALFGLMALTSCQKDPPIEYGVETILKADAPMTVTYDATEAKEWEFQEEGLLKVYGIGRPSEGYVEVYAYERLNDWTIRLWMKGMEWPDGSYHADMVPEPYMDISVEERSPGGGIRAELRPSRDGTVPTKLQFQLE